MDRQILNFTANEQVLTVDEPIRISTNKVNYIEAHFALGDNWSGYDSVRAVWFTDYQTISTVLDSQGVCRVPFEVMKRKGQVKVNLVGSISENDVLTDRLTSYPVVAVIVDCVAPITGAETSPITPSQFEQFVANVRADADRAEAGATSAETSAGESEASATASAQSATASANSASQAQTYAQNAQNYAVSAETAKDDAIDAKEDAESAKADAESARDQILGMRATANTLAEGSDATASYSDGLLTLGIPRGNTGAKGDKGDKGDTGATPNLTIGTVETLDPSESATATITGTDENPVLNLGLPKGEQGEVSQAQLDAAVTDLKSDLAQETNARTVADNALSARITDNDTDISALQTSVTNLGTHKVAQPLDNNNQPTNGTSGQSLRTKGDGTTEWADVGLPTDEQTAQAVSDWLDEHPEATTTVQDESLTYKKLVIGTLGFVTPEMFGAKGDGVTDDTSYIEDSIRYASGNEIPLYMPNEYKITSSIELSDPVSIKCNGKIIYSGNDYAFKIYKHNITLEFTELECSNGSGILISDDMGMVYYIRIKFDTITANLYGITFLAESAGIQNYYINGMWIYVPKLTAGTKAIYMDCQDGAHIGEGFINGVDLGGNYGIYVDGHTTGDVTGITFSEFSLEGDNFGCFNGIYLDNVHCSDFRDFRTQEVDNTGEGMQLILKGKTYGNIFMFDLLWLDKFDIDEMTHMSSDNIMIGVIRENTTQMNVIASGISFINGGKLAIRDFKPKQLVVTSSNSPARIQYDTDFVQTFLMDAGTQVVLDSKNFCEGFYVIVQTNSSGSIVDENGNYIVNLSTMSRYRNKILKISYRKYLMTTSNTTHWEVEDIRIKTKAYSTGGLSYGENITYTAGGWYQEGEMYIVNIRINASATISGGTVVVSGLPASVLNTNAIAVATNNPAVSAFLKTNGDIQVGQQFSGDLFLSCAYI